MTELLKRLFAVVMVGGILGLSAYAQQTGPKIIDRPPNDPSVHEGLSGETSAGVKTNIDPKIGQTPVINYSPFRGLAAWGSIVAPYSVPAPRKSDPSTIGFKYTFSQLFFPLFSTSGRTNRLFAGEKGIGGKNVTDVGGAGQVCGDGPGDLYWVGYPRPANPSSGGPPFFQLPAHPLDCFCRCNEMVYCPIGYTAKWTFYNGLAPGPVSCQVCFGPGNIGTNQIVKHDIYVGKNLGRAHFGYPASAPFDTGYHECLRQNQGDPTGGAPGNLNYGL